MGGQSKQSSTADKVDIRSISTISTRSNIAAISNFEETISVTPIQGQPGNFVSVHKPWGYPGLGRIAGSIPLGEAAAAAYKTVPAGHEVHCIQAQFTKPSLVGIPLHDQGEKEEDVKAVITFSVIQASIKDKGFPKKHEHLVTPSLNTLRVVKRPIDPELDDFNGPVRLNCTEGIPYPPFSSQRLEVTKEFDTNQRTYYAEIKSHQSDLQPSRSNLGFDTPFETQGIKAGLPARDDRTMTRTKSELLQFASLNHSLRFVRFDGFDVNEGVLFENCTKWAKGRRAVAQLIIRDIRGEVIAMAEQESYYVFLPPTDGDEGVESRRERADAERGIRSSSERAGKLRT